MKRATVGVMVVCKASWRLVGGCGNGIGEIQEVKCIKWTTRHCTDNEVSQCARQTREDGVIDGTADMVRRTER